MSYCNACGSEVPEAARFCQNCGAALAPAAPAGAAEAAPRPVSGGVPPPAVPPYAAPPPYAPPGFAPPPYAVLPGQPYIPARNGKAIAGMWLGIASIVPGSLMNWVGIVVGIIGLIFSLIALHDIRVFQRQFGAAAPYPGRTEAMAGAICAVVGIILSTAFLIYLLMNLERYGIRLTNV